MKKTIVKFRPQVFMIIKGLTRERAYEIARKKATRDWRGFSYDSKTGKATLI